MIYLVKVTNPETKGIVELSSLYLTYSEAVEKAKYYMDKHSKAYTYAIEEVNKLEEDFQVLTGHRKDCMALFLSKYHSLVYGDQNYIGVYSYDMTCKELYNKCQELYNRYQRIMNPTTTIKEQI